MLAHDRNARRRPGHFDMSASMTAVKVATTKRGGEQKRSRARPGHQAAT
jgi:hypothetical protein